MKGKKKQNQALEALENRAQKETVYNEFLTVKQISSYLAVKVSTIYTMVEQRKLPHYRIGRQIRFKRSEIDEWMAGQREAVVEVKMEARKVLRSIEKKSDLDINRITTKAIEEAKGKSYTCCHGKPDRNKGLGKEVDHGNLQEA